MGAGKADGEEEAAGGEAVKWCAVVVVGATTAIVVDVTISSPPVAPLVLCLRFR